MKRKLIIFVLVFLQANYLYLFKIPSLIPGETASFTNASDTLTNARLSYRGHAANASAATSYITMSADADQNTNHLFPNDTICFSGGSLDGCSSQTNYTVANVIDTTHFNISPALVTALTGGGSDYVISTQAATHTIAFQLTNAVPSNGDILLTIPAVRTAGKTNDGMPDTNTSIATNGFDLNGLVAGDVSVTGCTDSDWVATETITAGDGSTDHTIRIDRQNTSCAAGTTVTVTVGGTHQLINPAPISTGHTQGVADVYTINVKTRDGSDNTLDQNSIKVAVEEGVLVSATVQETLTMTVAGVASSTSACGQTTDVTSTATSVPWGTISNFGAFQEAAQTVTVSTNADSGYNIKVEENDQMGKDGKTCTSPTDDTAGEADNCIQDTVCGGSACSEATSQDWTSTSYYGLGYSLANVAGTDAAFTYNESSRTFSTKQFADQHAGNTKAIIMQNSGPTSSSQAYLCYRLNVSSTQPAGYYYNKVKLTATAIF